MPYIPPAKSPLCSSPTETCFLDAPWSVKTTATNISAPSTNSDASSHPVFTESDDESDNGSRNGRPVVRKLSGDLVRPILRLPSRRRHASLPSSPTVKSVHFNSHLEETLYFIRRDCPLSLSAVTTPTQACDGGLEHDMYCNAQSSLRRWEMITPNFPQRTESRESQFVYLQALTLLDDQESLQGLVAVRNVAYHKSVACRFTFDNWKTISEVVSIYKDKDVSDKTPPNYDLFVFTIRLSDIVNLETSLGQLCVRYNVNGREYWDNNSGRNFHACFFKKAASQAGCNGCQDTPLRSADAIPATDTQVKLTSNPFRGLDLVRCYSISATLDATVRAAKCFRKHEMKSESTARGNLDFTTDLCSRTLRETARDTNCFGSGNFSMRCHPESHESIDRVPFCAYGLC